MKIKTYGYGGVYTAGTASTPEARASSLGRGAGSSSKDKTPLKDNIIKLLEDNALPNDNRATLELAERVLSQYELDPSIDITVSDYMMLKKAINDNKTNNEVWKKASEYIYSKDTAEEVALDASGRMYVSRANEDGKSEYTVINPEQYQEAKEEGWKALSNAGLLTERANNDDLIWRMDIISSVNSSTNAATIGKKLIDEINALPETEQGIILNKRGQLQSILHGASTAMAEGPDTYYKYTSKTDIPQDQSNFMDFAWNYILNENERNHIKAAVALRGGDPTNAAACYQVIQSALKSYTHFDSKVDYDSAEAQRRAKAGGEGEGAMGQRTLLESYMYGNNEGRPDVFYIAPKGSEAITSVVGSNIGPLVTNASSNEQRVNYGRATLDTIMSGDDAAYQIGRSMMNTRSVSFGNTFIDPTQLDGVMYNGGNATRVKLPAIKEPDGRIRPNLDLIAECNEIKEKAKESGQTAFIDR